MFFSASPLITVILSIIVFFFIYISFGTFLVIWMKLSGHTNPNNKVKLRHRTRISLAPWVKMGVVCEAEDGYYVDPETDHKKQAYIWSAAAIYTLFIIVPLISLLLGY